MKGFSGENFYTIELECQDQNGWIAFMDFIKLIRNTWFLVIFSVFFSGITWASFQAVYRKELLLQKIYRSEEMPDVSEVMMLYNKMMKSTPNRKELNSYYRLAKVLARVEKKREMVKILKRLLILNPEDSNMRLWLALELHNQKRYREAEKHFTLLLKGKTKK